MIKRKSRIIQIRILVKFKRKRMRNSRMIIKKRFKMKKKNVFHKMRNKINWSRVRIPKINLSLKNPVRFNKVNQNLNYHNSHK